MSLLRLQPRIALRVAPAPQRLVYRQAHKTTKAITTSSIPPLRIFALPLCQSPTDPSKPLIYWHVAQHSPASEKANQSVSLDYRQPATWLPYGIDKASSLWLSWGDSPKVLKEGEKKSWEDRVKGMKYWVWKNGERLMDKIEYEEWGLKAINPNIPALPKGINSNDASNQEYQIPLLYPAAHPSLSATPDIAALLRAHLAHRIPYHKRLLIRSLILLPFTLPVAALPIVPNLPGFYVAFRAYSHWKALHGAQWLSRTIGEEAEGRIRVEASEVLAGCFVTPSSMPEPSAVGSSTEDGIDHASSSTAPDTTSTPSTYPMNTARPLDVQFSGQTTAEKATNMTNLTHGASSTVPTASSNGNQDDGVNHSSKNVSFDTTSTPPSRIHPSQRDTPAHDTITANKTSQTTITPATPLFTVPPPAGAKSHGQAEIENKVYLPLANLPRLVKAFDLSPPHVVDVSRAIVQARSRLVKAAKEAERQKSI